MKCQYIQGKVFQLLHKFLPLFSEYVCNWIHIEHKRHNYIEHVYIIIVIFKLCLRLSTQNNIFKFIRSKRAFINTLEHTPVFVTQLGKRRVTWRRD